MKFIEGGVCAAKGFAAGGIHVGVKSKNPEKKDLALIVSDVDCSAAAIYTTNAVQAAPIHVTRYNLENGCARAIIANSGNANCCAPNDYENAQRMCAAASSVLNIPADDIAVCSTGVIGQELNFSVIEQGLPELVSKLSYSGSRDANLAIMTTDTTEKTAAVEFELGGKTVRMGGIAKGSGMIHPNMGTMLCFVTTDAAIAPSALKEALLTAALKSFNRISVDGDTSTNDTFCILANGLADNFAITSIKSAEYEIFVNALTALCIDLARKMASDGEGAKHLITCTVKGAITEYCAEVLAKSVICSTLTKAAIFGCDANWGRILCAMGYSGIDFYPEKVSITLSSAAGSIDVCKNGRGLPFDEDLAKKILSEHDVEIIADMHYGDFECTCWGCDITYDYIKINGDYRT